MSRIAARSVLPLALLVCDGDREARPLPPAPSGGGADDDGLNLTPNPCEADTCGEQSFAIRFTDPLTIYFLMDRSASMSAKKDGAPLDRYDQVRAGAAGLIDDLGPTIRVGAAVFPGADALGNNCDVGFEVMDVQAGDAFSKSAGPAEKAFVDTTDLNPEGATPMTATLAALRPMITATGDEVRVILMTDGVPTCDPHCDTIENCDWATHPAIDEVAAYAAAGVPVAVVSIEGANHDALQPLALAGGLANPDGQANAYYTVDDIDELTDVLLGIVGQSVPCDFDLDPPPADPDLVSVLMNCDVLPRGADGWTFAGPAKILLTGEACTRLRTGKVTELRATTGCPVDGAR